MNPRSSSYEQIRTMGLFYPRSQKLKVKGEGLLGTVKREKTEFTMQRGSRGAAG